MHVFVDAQGQFIHTQLSNGHTSDIKILPKLAQGYKGKIFGDRGYISEILKDKLGAQGVELITYHRKNMRPLELSLEDELMLKQRNKIETIFSLLKQQ
ncbi:transposase, partial [Acinetobacter sp. B51(2017)]|uniref:transposase n=1 Tax=Acinetobacter sp. B51(2017) TaxID=2060938 RepID=UPI002076DC18